MSSTIGDISLEIPVMNAACSVAKTVEEITALSHTSVSVITVGSITVEQRSGNPEPRWSDHTDFALNSFGMPNAGLNSYEQMLPEMISIARGSNKKLSVSIAGFNVPEYVSLAGLAQNCGADILELNLGCPNMQINGVQKPIASFDLQYMEQIVKQVSATTSMPLMLKLSPYSNPAELQSTAAFIRDVGTVAAVVTSNTFANGYWENDALAMKYGGVSGRAMLPIALGQVKQFREALPESIAVIGVGGIETKDDVNRYLQAGASAVQAATLIVRDGHAALERLTR